MNMDDASFEHYPSDDTAPVDPVCVSAVCYSFLPFGRQLEAGGPSISLTFATEDVPEIGIA
jgi:hypothetical protein